MYIRAQQPKVLYGHRIGEDIFEFKYSTAQIPRAVWELAGPTIERPLPAAFNIEGPEARQIHVGDIILKMDFYLNKKDCGKIFS